MNREINLPTDGERRFQEQIHGQPDNAFAAVLDGNHSIGIRMLFNLSKDLNQSSDWNVICSASKLVHRRGMCVSRFRS